MTSASCVRWALSRRADAGRRAAPSTRGVPSCREVSCSLGRRSLLVGGAPPTGPACQPARARRCKGRAAPRPRVGADRAGAGQQPALARHWALPAHATHALGSTVTLRRRGALPPALPPLASDGRPRGAETALASQADARTRTGDPFITSSQRIRAAADGLRVSPGESGLPVPFVGLCGSYPGARRFHQASARLAVSRSSPSRVSPAARAALSMPGVVSATAGSRARDVCAREPRARHRPDTRSTRAARPTAPGSARAARARAAQRSALAGMACQGALESRSSPLPEPS
jgi:hypothetical protein